MLITLICALSYIRWRLAWWFHLIFMIRDVVHHEFLAKLRTVSCAFYQFNWNLTFLLSYICLGVFSQFIVSDRWKFNWCYCYAHLFYVVYVIYLFSVYFLCAVLSISDSVVCLLYLIISNILFLSFCLDIWSTKGP